MLDAVPGGNDSQSNFSDWYWILLISIYLLGVLTLFNETARSMAAIWERSDTYAHGYLILPIALWLAWKLRFRLSMTELQPNPWILLLSIPVGFIWLLASLVDVLVVQQLMFVGILIVGVWAIVGNAMARVLAFPLGFIFLAVPMGEDLVPPMMDLTAAATVWLVQASGIPVYREGLFFTLPTGQWSVVEACSGMRYVIASFTLGLLYAYLFYHSLGRRLLFVLVSILVPVVANVIRAYLIVMLGHLSGMKLATSVDHLIYGWIFFGLVMLLMFWLGSFWREDDLFEYETDLNRALSQERQPGYRGLYVLFLTLFVSAFWPWMAQAIQAAPASELSGPLVRPVAQAPWSFSKSQEWDWRLTDDGAGRRLVQFYTDDEAVVAMYIDQYSEQQQGAELVGNATRFLNRELGWRIVERDKKQAKFGDKLVSVDRIQTRGPKASLLVWSWYRIGDRYTADPYLAKLLEAFNQITFASRDSARINLVTEALNERTGQMVLQSFLDGHLNQIEKSLDHAAGKAQ